MPKYTITFTKEHGGKYYQTIVHAEDERQAFLKARDEAKTKGIKLPDEVWTRTHMHKDLRVQSFISLIKELINVGIIDEDHIDIEVWVNNYIKEIDSNK